jgi:hypothetical protein
VRDADRTRPGLWRWVAFWTLVLAVVSLWRPVVPSEPPAPDAPATAFAPANLLLLGVLVVLAVLVVPASRRIRWIAAGILVGTTTVAWLLEDPIREFLGPPFAPSGTAAPAAPPAPAPPPGPPAPSDS